MSKRKESRESEIFDDFEVPKYIRVIDKDTLEVHGGLEWEGFAWHKVRFEDVKRYFENPSYSTVRFLGSTLRGDWRPMDELAWLCLGIFKRLRRVK